ncbi:AAA family ATPase [Candidatus Woesearchaeota archaeon]|nr:AAA family ATPase [Candidatus Woesearchaeota archaeon]
MNKIICLVGMCGAGKSVVGDILKEKGFEYARFGDLTDDVLFGKRPEIAEKIGLKLPAERDETNERLVREGVRKIYGMDAYAKLNISKFDAALEKGDLVADGLYSWEEFKVLKDYYKGKIVVLAVMTSPGVRYKRLAARKERPLTKEESKSRDFAEIENLNKGGPIAMADYYVINNFSFEFIQKEIENFLRWMKDVKA